MAGAARAAFLLASSFFSVFFLFFFCFFSVFFLFFSCFFFVSVFILFFHFPASSSLSGTFSTFLGEIGTPEAWIRDGGA